MSSINKSNTIWQTTRLVYNSKYLFLSIMIWPNNRFFAKAYHTTSKVDVLRTHLWTGNGLTPNKHAPSRIESWLAMYHKNTRSCLSVVKASLPVLRCLYLRDGPNSEEYYMYLSTNENVFKIQFHSFLVLFLLRICQFSAHDSHLLF